MHEPIWTGRPYEEDDILEIARGQIETENAASINTDGLLFCDTELMVTRIWSLVKYGRCHPWIDQVIRDHRYDLVLLCNIDLPWEYDPLREHPSMRGFLLEYYEKELQAFGIRYHLVSGSGRKRLLNAVSVINRYCCVS